MSAAIVYCVIFVIVCVAACLAVYVVHLVFSEIEINEYMKIMFHSDKKELSESTKSRVNYSAIIGRWKL